MSLTVGVIQGLHSASYLKAHPWAINNSVTIHMEFGQVGTQLVETLILCSRLEALKQLEKLMNLSCIKRKE